MSVFSLQQLVDEVRRRNQARSWILQSRRSTPNDFAANFRGNPRAPCTLTVMHLYSGTKVLTTELIHGIKVTNIDAL